MLATDVSLWQAVRMKSCLEISEPYFEALQRRQVNDVQIMGGVGSAALVDPDLFIDDATQTLIPLKSIDLPQFRPGGSKRDLDVLVLSTDQGTIDSEEALAQEIIGEDLDLSFFGLLKASTLHHQASRPLRSTARTFLADRYVNSNQSGGIEQAYKALYPFSIEVDPAAFETWHLQYNGISVPIPHPGTSLLNYVTRSISGLRTKDVAKVTEITDNILGKSPEVKEWMLDGPGRGMLHFARILHTVREPRNNPRPLDVGEHLTLPPVTEEELEAATNPLLHGMSDRERRVMIAVARLKARTLHKAESNQRLVDFFQNRLERRVDGIVKNK